MSENYISEADLKKLTKFVLKEIAPVPTKKTIKSFFDAIIQSLDKEQDENPIVVDIKRAHDLSNELSSMLTSYIRNAISSSFKGDEQGYKSNVAKFGMAREDFMHLMIIWARNIDKKVPGRKDDIHRIMQEIKRHVEQIGQMTAQIITNYKTYKNFINAKKEIEHLGTIFAALRESYNELFTFALQVGLGNSINKKNAGKK